MTERFEGSNPTWVKRAKSDDELLDISPDDLDSLILAEQEDLWGRLMSAPRGAGRTSIVTASSDRLPIADDSVDLILTSPPYLTRIDYGVAYCRELAVLGIDVLSNRDLRADLMGTTLIRGDAASQFKPGKIACDLMHRVSSHSSKASGGYYLKQTRQYLRDLSAGFDEMTRVVKPGGTLCMVVQDSYYKDEPVPLADICIDEAEVRGWGLVLNEQFPVKRTLTTLNKSAREYKKAQVSESVITFSLRSA
ncbi:DNA methyltransferase [Streptomyces yokosukanensis]|nr:DNA methyltransferase [Streptomyces yokosukanensis]